jgi:hypothetical protein
LIQPNTIPFGPTLFILLASPAGSPRLPPLFTCTSPPAAPARLTSPFSFLPAHQPPRHTKARNNPLLLSLTDALSPCVILYPPPSFPLHRIRRSKPPPSFKSRAPSAPLPRLLPPGPTCSSIPSPLVQNPVQEHPQPRRSCEWQEAITRAPITAVEAAGQTKTTLSFPRPISDQAST